MKKISLSILAVMIAGATVFAHGGVPVKKAKQATCTNCKKGKCTEKTCTNKAKCCK